ncbi:pimeloyl-ACP methyl ester carboxylesterase [Ureibacillus xyleni]|uniref:Pimeloyl-ACP methyl ester carboxylesterase n=1 Tax=Ureibacillus xyleni TaxID=614648 RepID=A0A285RD17_9BACL|nr:alpha/beta hydrolase [Ureibacillus xyleni]SOB91970.1 pimeloyl-ACP methyl ester carboxylesterase [Ureibacillus xyleni]
MSKKTFKTDVAKQIYFKQYDRSLKLWGIELETDYIETSFGKTHVIVCGPVSAPPLVLIHGMTVSSTMWFANAPTWSKHFRIYAIDIVGDFGKSECTKSISTSEDINTWLDELLDSLGLDKVFLAGHSMGGWMSLQYCLNSNRVKKLVLLAPVMSFDRLNWKFPLKLFPAMWFKKTYFIKKLYKWLFAKNSVPDQVLFNQFVVGYKFGVMQLRVPPRTYNDEEIRNLKTPTLLLIGNEEVVYSSVDKAFERASTNPIITTKLVVGASHCLSAEQKDEVNKLVTDYLIAN